MAELIGNIIGFIFGSMVVIIASAVQAAIGGAVLAGIIFLLSLGFGKDPNYVAIFQTLFWIMFVGGVLYAYFKYATKRNHWYD